MIRRQNIQWLTVILIGFAFFFTFFSVEIPVRTLSRSDDIFNFESRLEELERYIHYMNTSTTSSKRNLGYLQDTQRKNNELLSNCSYVLIILVTSHASNLAQRQLIRRTWGTNTAKLNAFSRKTFFVVGKWNVSLSDEINTYNDIIVSNEKEDFYNLVPKIKNSFKWVTKYCSFRYLLKTDDDVFVNIPRLFLFLNDPKTPKTELYAGNVNYMAPVQREGRYGISEQEYGKSVYPRYCSGGGFVVSLDTAERFLQYTDEIKSIKIDDAFLGEVALKAGIDVHHDENFRMFERLDKCTYNFKTIVHHPVKTKACMRSLYSKMKTF